MENFLLIVIVVAAIALGIVRRNKSAGGRDRKRDEPQTPVSERSAPAKRTQSEDAAVSKPRQAKAKPQPVPAEQSAPSQPGVPSGEFARSAVGTGLFEGVRAWGYQLQKVNMKDVAASPFDLMVIDYSRDGSDELAFTPGDIARMKIKPDGGRRHVLAYMSIGEAESYRYYWDPAWSAQKPSWLLDENPDWKENFTVCFWEPGWQAQFCGNPTAYLDKIMAAGFDGVYLDKCDVFEDLQERNKKVARSRPDLEGDMVNFISRLSQYAKARKPMFSFVMQNAEVLLEHEHLREAIDGVAKESLLFGLSGPEKPNPKDEITFAARALSLAQSAGRTVFVVEYLNDADKIRSATEALDRYGFISTISPKNRNLAHLNTDPAIV
ncbi:MAG: MJ1477/TM1410 family putative glycoside hydrolase [Hyphomicrobiaceae bacterium]